MTVYAQLTQLLALMALVCLLMALTAQAAGLRINTTKSIPLGIYRAVDEPMAVGAYVMFCPPNREPFLEAKKRGYLTIGFCEGEFGYMMKKILAAKKDQVSIGAAGVLVNAKLLDLSKPLLADQHGRAMPVYQPKRFTLQENEWLLMSDVSATSFDGRYFGPISSSQITTVIRPVFLW